MKIKEKILRMANRDMNMRTNIKKGYLGKERNAEKSYRFLNFSFFLLYRRFKLSFKIIVVVTNKMSRIKENVCIKLNIFYDYLAKLGSPRG